MPFPVDINYPDIVCHARLEPSVMVADYTPSIQANVHDALWMLTQQFRVGEYQGTDGGTLVKAKIETQSNKVNRYRSTPDQPAESFNEEIPLEAKVERLPFKMDLGFALQLGYRWFKLLKMHIPATDYRQNFIDAYPFGNIDGEAEPEKASNATAMQIRKLTLTRAMDGVAFYEYLLGGGHASDTVPGVAAITAAEQDFLNWINNTYYVPDTPEDTSWSVSQLEYQCAISAPQGTAQTAPQTVLLADKYKRGNVDWYSFDLDNVGTDKLVEGPGTTIDNSQAILSPEVFTYIPHTIEFKGMPKGRWWEFEDRNIDLSKMMTQKQDISKMVVTEFGLIYSNDWFIIPHVVQDNTITKINGLVATDVFGRQFLVKRAGDGIGWQKWDMYNISKKGTMDQESYDNLLMLAALKNRMQGDPVEQVSFLRDEMANMAWGVEEIVPDELMGGVDGKTAAQSLTDYLNSITNPTPPPGYINNDALFRYRISNAVPENWIPFIPVKLGSAAARNIVVRRATLHRYISDNYTTDLVHPRTDILSYGLDTTPTQYYDINEEEVCRQGLSITANYQRTRWYNGQTYTWLGRMVKSGKGEGNSGLKFDILEDKEPDPA